jgi:transcriptional regulator with XRE-family HTH domain
LLTKSRDESSVTPLTRTYIAEWRKYRGLSLRKLAPLVRLSASRISQIEQGNEPYNQRFIERCAKALQCRVVDLLSRSPPGTEATTQDMMPPSHIALMHQLLGEIEACQKASGSLNQQLLFLGALATQLIGHSDKWEDAIRSFVERASHLYPTTDS